MITVILVSWKRFDRLHDILQSWLSEPLVSEIILWDNSGSFKTNLPVKVINSQFNFNPSVRYMLGSIATNDILVHCDDDVLPKHGVIADFLTHFQPQDFLGVEGINFVGSSYFHQKRIKAQEINQPVKVDLVVGFLTMIHKNNLLNMNYYNFSKYQLEMNLQCLVPMNKMVIPSINFQELPCSKDTNALHLMEVGHSDKEQMYQQYFSKRRLFL